MPADAQLGDVVDVPGPRGQGTHRAIVISVDPWPEYVELSAAVDVLRARFDLPTPLDVA